LQWFLKALRAEVDLAVLHVPRAVAARFLYNAKAPSASSGLFFDGCRPNATSLSVLGICGSQRLLRQQVGQ